MTNGTASGSVSFVSRIAHAFGQRLLVLAGRVRVADVDVQAGHLCARTTIRFHLTGHRQSPRRSMNDMEETLKNGRESLAYLFSCSLCRRPRSLRCSGTRSRRYSSHTHTARRDDTCSPCCTMLDTSVRNYDNACNAGRPHVRNL